MLRELRYSACLAGGTIAICVVGYSLLILVIAAVAAPEKRMGSLIRNEVGTVVGSRLLAQQFTQAEYLWPRPSAVDYDAAAAGGSNLSPANPAITERAEKIIARYGLANGEKLPAELVLASGAGLDPHITEQAAIFQARRVAEARGIGENQLKEWITRQSAARGTLSADPLINVLEFNLLLDKKFPLTSAE